MSETGDNSAFPRPGHSDDLAEWARRFDDREALDRMQRINSINAELAEVIGEDRAREISAELLALGRLAVGYKMSDVFNGEAYNG